MGLVDIAASTKRIFDLAVPLENGMPTSGHHPPFQMALLRRHGDKVREGADGGTSANELITTGCHIGTHIDAIGHWAVDGRVHGDLDAVEAMKGGSFRSLGSEHIAPMVCRGVLFDIPEVHGVNRLKPGQGVTPEDLEKALGDKKLNAGDVALIRTGWHQLYLQDTAAYFGWREGVPGVTGLGAEWLAQHRVQAAGTDTAAFDQIVPGPKFLARPAHMTLLFKHAIHIIENLDLEELAAEGVKEFLFIMAPLKLVGATGSPIRPLAVVES